MYPECVQWAALECVNDSEHLTIGTDQNEFAVGTEFK